MFTKKIQNVIIYIVDLKKYEEFYQQDNKKRGCFYWENDLKENVMKKNQKSQKE